MHDGQDQAPQSARQVNMSSTGSDAVQVGVVQGGLHVVEQLTVYMPAHGCVECCCDCIGQRLPSELLEELPPAAHLAARRIVNKGVLKPRALTHALKRDALSWNGERFVQQQALPDYFFASICFAVLAPIWGLALLANFGNHPSPIATVTLVFLSLLTWTVIYMFVWPQRLAARVVGNPCEETL